MPLSRLRKAIEESCPRLASSVRIRWAPGPRLPSPRPPSGNAQTGSLRSRGSCRGPGIAVGSMEGGTKSCLLLLEAGELLALLGSSLLLW